MPLRRLDTLKEASSVDMLDESKEDERSRARPGMSRTKSSSSDSHIPAPRRQFDNNRNSDDYLRNGHHDAETKEEEEEQEQQPPSPSPAWAAEPRDNAAQNPLLRRPQWNPRKK